MPNAIDVTGDRYGRLVALRRGPNKGRRTTWACLCDCGNEHNVDLDSLRQGLTKSCGCLHSEAARKMITRNRPPEGARFSHGMSDSPEYSSWCAMKKRCLNPNSIRYERWGGRGIKICPQWLSSFETFYADMGDRPSPAHSLDRRDNDGNYEPRNCRWATHKEQRNNRSST